MLLFFFFFKRPLIIFLTFFRRDMVIKIFCSPKNSKQRELWMNKRQESKKFTHFLSAGRSRWPARQKGFRHIRGGKCRTMSPST